MRLATLLFAALLAALPASRPAAAAELALVLLTDVSRSMDDEDFAMVKAGYEAAFRDPEVLAAVGSSGGIAIAYAEFSGVGEFRLVEGWREIGDEASTRAFGAAIAAAPRSFDANTALAAALKSAVRLLDAAPFPDMRRVIDIASDEPYDGGRAASVRDAAVEAGIVINALPIIDDRMIGTFDGKLTYSAVKWGVGGAMAFYQRDIVGGPGSFVLRAQSYRDFGDALKRKLLLEIAGIPPTTLAAR